MKAVVAAFNQEKAPVGAFSVIMNLRMDLFEALQEAVGETIITMDWNFKLPRKYLGLPPTPGN